jgi:hypothetical protein
MFVTPIAGGWSCPMTPGASPRGVITGLRIRVRRPERERGACKEKEKSDFCFSMARPDTVIHASTPPGYDFFPGHRLPPFFQIRFFSFLNEPPVKGRIHGRDLSAAGSSYSHFAGNIFDNVIFIAPLLSRIFPETMVQPFDKT